MSSKLLWPACLFLVLLGAPLIASADENENELLHAQQMADSIVAAQVESFKIRQIACVERARSVKLLPDDIRVLPLPKGKLITRLGSAESQYDGESAGWADEGIVRMTNHNLTVYAFVGGEISKIFSGRTNLMTLSAPPLNQRVISVNRAMGWRVSKEEVIAFASPGNYQDYRRALGINGQHALLWGRGWLKAAQEKSGFNCGELDKEYQGRWVPSHDTPRTFALGDAIGKQILTVRANLSSDNRIMRRSAVESIQPWRGFVHRSSTHPPEVGRMHGHVLVNALAQGGTQVPLWLQWGIAVLSSQEMLRANGFNESSPFFLDKTNQEAKAIITKSGALNPRDWQRLIASLQGDPYPHFKVLHIEAQAQRMTRFFYGRFGTGAVVETLQRLGSGQSVDEALFATTGLTEVQFFAAWMAAENI